jgi:hypothetical protein
MKRNSFHKSVRARNRLRKADAPAPGMYEKARSKALSASKKLVDLHHQRASGGEVSHMHIAVAAEAAKHAHEKAMVHATKPEDVNMHEKHADKATQIVHHAHTASLKEAFHPEVSKGAVMDFNDFFKSEDKCSECGQDIEKSHGPTKGSVAADNKKGPKHAGSTSGNVGKHHVGHYRGKGGNTHKKNDTEKSEGEETQTLRKAFPVSDTFKAVEYVNENGELFSEMEQFALR